MSDEVTDLSTPEGDTAVEVTGTGTRPSIISDATTRHGDVPVQTRNARFTSADVADYPEVTGREGNWKLTPVDRIGDLIAGELDGGRYEFAAATVPGIDVSWVPRSDERIGLAGIPEEKSSANAWSTFGEALAITISGEELVELTVDRSSFGSGARGAHTIIEAKPFSNAVVVLDNSGAATLSENVEIIVGDSARLTLVTVQDFDDDARYLATHFGSVGRDSYLKHVVVSLGGSIVRVNPSVTLGQPGAEGELLGIYFSDAGQHLEQQVFMFHKAPNTKGRVNYKGALQGQGARSVWIGDVLIGPDASGTDSYEQNRNLVLTDGTRADSIPNLEIETGDILGAGHASATGRFDDEQLFYLRSRGISEEQARRLVVRGFLVEIVQKIGSPALEERLHDAIEAELAGPSAVGA
ncbi:Fe-S cluster assembly protein SufD [Amnibacterium flavum]|uniref:Fe-S cluster assembly protein SufD n=1 Tax=Amnibacterium flavum TaxID=2173173 RepID=A0A2V1HX98_9MICO|nr:Fe-S cluster assembly protein SufD [Amnibacterium flavum]